MHGDNLRLDDLPTGAILLRGGTVVAANALARDVLGVTPATGLAGCALDSLFEPDDGEDILSALRARRAPHDQRTPAGAAGPEDDRAGDVTARYRQPRRRKLRQRTARRGPRRDRRGPNGARPRHARGRHLHPHPRGARRLVLARRRAPPRGRSGHHPGAPGAAPPRRPPRRPRRGRAVTRRARPSRVLQAPLEPGERRRRVGRRGHRDLRRNRQPRPARLVHTATAPGEGGPHSRGAARAHRSAVARRGRARRHRRRGALRSHGLLQPPRRAGARPARGRAGRDRVDRRSARRAPRGAAAHRRGGPD